MDKPCGCKHSNPFTCAEKRTLDRIPCSCACHLSAPPSSKDVPEVIPWERLRKMAERDGVAFGDYIASMNAHILNQRDEINRLRPAAESWESYVAAQERKGQQGETPREPARDADHCDFPDCEQHWCFVADRQRELLELWLAAYGTENADGLSQRTRDWIKSSPPKTNGDPT